MVHIWWCLWANQPEVRKIGWKLFISCWLKLFKIDKANLFLEQVIAPSWWASWERTLWVSEILEAVHQQPGPDLWFPLISLLLCCNSVGGHRWDVQELCGWSLSIALKQHFGAFSIHPLKWQTSPFALWAVLLNRVVEAADFTEQKWFSSTILSTEHTFCT